MAADNSSWFTNLPDNVTLWIDQTLNAMTVFGRPEEIDQRIAGQDSLEDADLISRRSMLGLPLLAASLTLPGFDAEAAPAPPPATAFNWDRIAALTRQQPPSKQIPFLNATINQIEYALDLKRWRTPQEVALHQEADCKEYALCKYWLLREMGIPADALRLGYCFANTVEGKQAHMVVLLRGADNKSTLVLCNLTDVIATIEQRTDLDLKFRFNENGFWDAQGLNPVTNVRLAHWPDVWLRSTSNYNQVDRSQAASVATSVAATRSRAGGALTGTREALVDPSSDDAPSSRELAVQRMR